MLHLFPSLLLLLVASCSRFGGVYEAEKVAIGGVPQHLLAKGRARDLPVLLIVHGGPGVPEMPMSAFNRELENDFIVVYWDQRSAGKSYQLSGDNPVPPVDRYVADLLEVTDHLRAKFSRERIHLTGFSFGSLLGIRAVHRHPEKYLSYTGISQFVSVPASEHQLQQQGIAAAKAANDRDTLAILQKYGDPIDDSEKQAAEVNRALTRQALPKVRRPFGAATYLTTATFGGLYSPLDVLRTIRGRRHTGEALKDELYSIDLRREIQRLEVPVAFCFGRWDRLLSPDVGAEFAQKLHAPAGKSIIWFEKSGHALHLQNPHRFQQVLRAQKEAAAARELRRS